MVSRFYVPPEAINDKIITVTGGDVRHIVSVMRLGKSDRVVVFDGTGAEYAGVIKEVLAKSLKIEIIETRPAPATEGIKITLIQSIPKKEKMDYIVEKATELGVGTIIPVTTKRTIVEWDERKCRTAEMRWRKIALEAAKQCGRVDVPKIDPVRRYSELIKAMPSCELALIAALDDSAIPLKDAIAGFKSRDGKIAVAIGPEGDFTPDEIAAAKEAGFRLISLGRRVLKSDTAGLAVLAVLNYEFSGRY